MKFYSILRTGLVSHNVLDNIYNEYFCIQHRELTVPFPYSILAYYLCIIRLPEVLNLINHWFTRFLQLYDKNFLGPLIIY